MERETNSQKLDTDSSNATTYAAALQRGKAATEDASNNNPLQSDISNGNSTSNGNNSSREGSTDKKGSAVLDKSKNSVLSNKSLNDSFEDTEDSQLTFNSQASKDPSSDCNVNSDGNFETSVSTTTEVSSAVSSNNLEMNEPSSGKFYFIIYFSGLLKICKNKHILIRFTNSEML